MEKDVKVPLSLDEFPQQKLYLLKQLPEKPATFTCGFTHRGDGAPEGLAPDEMPQTARLVASVEWAWSPMHNRIDAYFLSTNQKRSHWLLWLRWLQDGEYPWTWEEYLYAYGPMKGVPPRTAAVHLLQGAWLNECESFDLDSYHWINDLGLLDVGDLEAISAAVWGQAGDES